MTTVQMGNTRRHARNHSVLRNPAHTTLVEGRRLPCDGSTRRDQIGYRAVQLTMVLAGLAAASMALVDLLGWAGLLG